MNKQLKGKLPFESSYTFGPAGEKTLTAIKEGKFVATHCATCDITYYPARHFCEKCFADIIEDTKEVGPEGEVVSVSRITVNLEGKRTKPYHAALIQLQGCNTVFLHKLKGADFKTGQKVRPVFKNQAERKGRITDILAFEIAKN
ncbi:Zn-ribbon domain-containing OB-fold protein [Elusimicrobiota bacterium]